MKDKKSSGASSPEAKNEAPAHVYDGDLIEEDNQLPLWWLYTLYGAIAFAAFYWYAEHKLEAFPSRATAHQEEMAVVRLEEAKRGNVSADTIIALSRTPSSVDKGKEVFTSVCVSCHRADGGGNIGPNLTDAAWIHGGEGDKIYQTIRKGVPAKGMPEWGPQLGDEKVLAVAAYVMTLKDTNVPGGKAPQGAPAKP
jgi:cytochrome c oxidase cbb3-type subunit 3